MGEGAGEGVVRWKIWGMARFPAKPNRNGKRSRWWYDSCGEKKHWNLGGGSGGWKICTPNLFDIFQLFLFGLCLGVISAWALGRIPGRCPSTRWGAVLAAIFWTFGHRKVTLQEISCHSLGIYWFFFGRLQDIQGLGTCFIWVAEFFFWGKRRRPCENPMRQNSFCFVVLKGMVINLPPHSKGVTWAGRKAAADMGCDIFFDWDAARSATRKPSQMFFFFSSPLCRECRVEGARQWSSAWYIFTNMLYIVISRESCLYVYFTE